MPLYYITFEQEGKINIVKRPWNAVVDTIETIYADGGVLISVTACYDPCSEH